MLSRVDARPLLCLCLALSAMHTHAQMSPVGTWLTFDNKSKLAKSEVVVSEVNGIVVGKVSKLLLKDVPQNAVCKLCTDDRKDTPIIGLEIIRGATKVPDKTVWEGGKVLEPESGKSYSLRLTPMDGGNKLEVYGSVLGFGRSHTWVRVR